MGQKQRVEDLERRVKVADEGDEIVMRWPEDPLYLVPGGRRVGSGLRSGDLVLRWPDGSEVLPP